MVQVRRGVSYTHYVNLEKERKDSHTVHNYDSKECERGHYVKNLRASSERDAVRQARAYLSVEGCKDSSCGHLKPRSRSRYSCQSDVLLCGSCYPRSARNRTRHQ